MKITRGYKTELDLTDKQRTACLKHAGCARFTYNWGLARAITVYRVTGKRPGAIQLHRELNALKKSEFPWMYEVSKCAMQEACVIWITLTSTSSAVLRSRKKASGKAKWAFPSSRKRAKALVPSV